MTKEPTTPNDELLAATALHNALAVKEALQRGANVNYQVFYAKIEH